MPETVSAHLKNSRHGHIHSIERNKMAGIKKSILDTVGNTPVVKINNIGPKDVDIYVKLEAFNPLGSVKDRLALNIIETAEADGSLKPGQTVIEATSGNTGIGLAMVCAQKGYPLIIVMAESFSIERRKLMRFLGAKVILTPAGEKGSGMVKKARELAKKHGWFLARQFENDANPDMHSKTTAQEILADFGDNGLDYWVTGFGTGGTLTGVARVLKDRSPATKVVVCEPDNARLLADGVKQVYNSDGSAADSHSGFRPHLMQGWTPDFIPKITNDAVVADLIDEMVPVAGLDAIACAKSLAQKEGIFCGTSGGATFAAALEIAKSAPKGSKILAMLPDTGERYLSTPLFEDVEETMTETEKSISDSTPLCRFGVSTAPVKAAAAAKPSDDAIKMLEQKISSDPVVLFSLEWCEFCWSIRKLFADAGIRYTSVDLDSVAYQKNNLGGDLRVALRDKTNVPTIPQLFIGGKHIGGATETFDAFNDGTLQKILAGNNIAYDTAMKKDAYSYLPKWLEPR